MTELDKFKRRTIRSVAHLLRQKKPPDELWGEMKKETGTDCRVLWERMRALCIKKLNRMLAANDRSDTLPSIARLSLTDWLLVDLVLVHEDIDVIAQDKQDSKMEQKPLVELFNLVQRFDVEGRSGEPLAEAWAAATVFYNRQGRQCSPMLLQRRWYQLKKLTRCRFYKFWQTYRGNLRLLSEAKQTMPNTLQMAVAKRYSAVITEAFPEWEELIEKRMIIMPEEFESKMRMKNLPKPCDSNDPDLVVVEPVIETIELGEDSDPENSKDDQIDDASNSEKSNDTTNDVNTTIEQQIAEKDAMFRVKVKNEPVEEDGLSNVQVVAATHVTEVEIPDIDSPEKEIESRSERVGNAMQVEENLTECDDLNLIESSPESDDALNLVENDDDVSILENDVENDVNLVENTRNADVNLVENSPDSDENLVEQNPDVDLTLVKDNLEAGVNITETNQECDTDVRLVDDSSDYEDDAIEIPTDIPSPELKVPHTEQVENMQAKATSPNSHNLSSNFGTVNLDDEIKSKAEEYCSEVSKEVLVEHNNSNFVDNLILNKMETYLNNLKEDNIEKKPDTIDLSEQSKMTAVDLLADLNFVDDGIEFVDDGVEFVEEQDVPKTESITETSPQQTNETDNQSNKFDLKLLMYPVVYTTKLDQMDIFRNKSVVCVRNNDDIVKVVKESKPVSKKSFSIKQEDRDIEIKTEPVTACDAGVTDDLFTNEQTSDEEADEDVTISPNSNMLKKPRNRTYNPINLCKNPDFNTKLKRLTIGFLSSTRNRQLLNACIPITIDVSKSFESKLVHGTLYLKSSGINIKEKNSVESPIVENQSSSIVPSAMPVQSLIDNSKTNIHELIRARNTAFPAHSDISERKKIINLPDIDKVRKINQQLLTAQVPPLRVYAGDKYRPAITQPTIPGNNEVKEMKSSPVAPQMSYMSVDTPPSPGTLPTVVKVESQANINNQFQTEKVAVSNSEQEKSSTESLAHHIAPPTSDVIPSIPSIVKVESQANLKDKPTETFPPAKQKLLKIINQAKILTQEALTKIDIGTMGASTSTKVIKKPVTKKNNYKPIDVRKQLPSRVQISWTPKYTARPDAIDDFLITDDTLNKMLHLISGESNEKECSCCSGKRKTEKKDKTKKQPVTSSIIKNDNNEEKETGKNATCAQAAASKSKPVAKGRVVRYCCWARQKLCNRRRITKHACQPTRCVCCCRDELQMKIEKEIKDIPNRPPAPIVVSDDEDISLKKACESIENVVQQARESTEASCVTYKLVAKTPPFRKAKPAVSCVSTSTLTDIASVMPSKITGENQTEMPTIQVVSDQSSGIPSIQLSVNQVPQSPTIHVPAPQIPEITINRQILPVDNGSLLFPVNPKTNSKQLSPSKSISHLKAIPCSCQRPAVTQGVQRNIVIDARCTTHPTPIAPKRENKVLYMHSKSISKNPSECPIFLGKNKILLTTVKFPRNTQSTLPESEVFQAPKIIPTLPLPTGVQLILLPSGKVSYTLDPGVNLTEAQLAALPTIMAAVQEQLNCSPASALAPVNASSEPNTVESTSDLSSDAGNPQIEVPENTNTLALNTAATSESEAFTPPVTIDNTDIVTTESMNISEAEISDTTRTLTNSNVLNDTEKMSSPLVSETEPVVAAEEVANKETNEDQPRENTSTVSNPQSSTETQSSVESDIQVMTENEATIEPKDQETANNRKSLLSDLMEMSGISAEDTRIVEPPVLVQPPILIEPPVIEQTPTEVINTDKVVLKDSEEVNLPELSPVTSFAELKYACDNNGKFFKLDYDTGIIVPINVCIKKSNKQKTPVATKPVTKAVIDLTDEPEKLENNSSTKSSGDSDIPLNIVVKKPTQYLYKGKTLNVTEPVKPIKLFKAVRPSLLKRPRKSPGEIPIAHIPKKPRLENRRKQDLGKVEAKIDLVDSDAPMEEEYLVDSSDDDSQSQEIQPVSVEALEHSDYSSDDEPLAKKSKRMKGDLVENENNESRENKKVLESNVLLAIDDADNDTLASNPGPAEEPSDVSKEPATAMECEDFPAEEDIEELSKDEETGIRFISDTSDNENNEEDCILGV